MDEEFRKLFERGMNARSPEEGVECFKKCLEIEPNNVYALNNLGIALYELGRVDEAESYINRAIELNPDLSLIHI